MNPGTRTETTKYRLEKSSNFIGRVVLSRVDPSSQNAGAGYSRTAQFLRRSSSFQVAQASLSTTNHFLGQISRGARTEDRLTRTSCVPFRRVPHTGTASRPAPAHESAPSGRAPSPRPPGSRATPQAQTATRQGPTAIGRDRAPPGSPRRSEHPPRRARPNQKRERGARRICRRSVGRPVAFGRVMPPGAMVRSFLANNDGTTWRMAANPEPLPRVPAATLPRREPRETHRQNLIDRPLERHREHQQSARGLHRPGRRIPDADPGPGGCRGPRR